MATCVRNIWLLAALYNVTIVTSHVYGSHNTVADLLSRWHNTVNNIEKLHAFMLITFLFSEPGAVTASIATEASARLFQGCRPATMTAYSRYFRDFLAFLVVAGLSLPQVSTIDIQSYMEYLHGNGMSPSNITNYVTGIRALYILYGLNTQQFRDPRIPLFIKALQINRLLKPTIVLLLDVELLEHIVDVCLKLQFPLVFKSLYLFCFFHFLDYLIFCLILPLF